MNKEFDFLKIISKSLDDSTFLGNDCAYLDEYKIAISKDVLIEDVHFSLSYMTPYEIAKKSLLVNVSDISASGAIPKYALIGLSAKLDDEFIKEFYKGINDTANEYGVKIIGGDLTKSEKIVVSITILGDYKNLNVSSRYNAKDGYITGTIGEFGSSAQGLIDLTKGFDNYFTKFHKSPVLYPKYAFEIAKNTEFPYAMMDSSDGLIDCLNQISSKSKVKIDVEYDKIPKKIENKDLVLNGGEDYSLVVCLNKKDFEKFPFLTEIGICSKGEGVFVDGIKKEFEGFKHF